MSSWVSCQKIVFNLHKSYQLNKNLDLQNFNFSVDQTQEEIIQVAQAIVEAKPEVVLILDHKPHPYGILKILIPLLQKEKIKPRFVFHIFGDFTLYYSHWNKLSEMLVGYEVDFIVASDRQKHMIDKYLPEDNKCHVCPFPVDKSEFSFTESVRKMQRKDWGLKDDDYAFVFTGRLSRQKRTHTLLTAFSDFMTKAKTTKAHLYLYGNTDHIGDQFVGKWEMEGEYFRKINRVYKSLPEEVQKNIHFMGGVPNAELKGVYQGADMLVNLSVHNDEDYGMSVAEAQCSGMPSILTDWGGLASFYHDDMPEAVKFIPVKIGLKSKLIHYESVVLAMEEAFKKSHFKNREEIAKKSMARFGVEAGHEIVTTILATKPKPFTQFTPFFDKVLEKYSLTGTPYITESKTINKLYREIYSSYVRDH